MRLVLLLIIVRFVSATDYYVSPKGRDVGMGSAAAPFRSIGHAVKRAVLPGDRIIIRRGIYREKIHTFTSGKKGRRIQIIGRPGTEVHFAGYPLKISHDYISVRGIVFDGLWVSKPVASIHGQHVTIKNCEFKNSKRDIVTLGNVEDVTIDSCFIHSGYSWWPRTHKEPHGISTKGVRNLRIRRCFITQITGDCIQISPSRDNWNNVKIEDCVFSINPISAEEARQAGLPEEAIGQILAENAIDLKARKTDDPDRHHILIRRCRARGFHSTRISNAAAFNIKNPVTCILDGITAYDNEIAFRLRKPARITLQNSLMYNNDIAIRVENPHKHLRLLNNTFGLNNKKVLKWIGPISGVWHIYNNLLVTPNLPSPLSKDLILRAANMNLPAYRIALYFKNAQQNDYRLIPGAPAIDNGKEFDGFNPDHDIRNKKRPHGAGYDFGAYEFEGEKNH